MKILTIDIGGTNIKAAVCREPGKLSEERVVPTQAWQGGRRVIERVISILEDYGEADAIGISSAGQIDAVEGKVLYANENIPGYTGMPVKEILEKKFGVPVLIENDVNAAAVGEGIYGAARGIRNYLCLTYGTGVGGAAVVNGVLYRGKHGGAGEFGHMILFPDGKSCACGGKGCYEQYASVNALLRLAESTGAVNGYEIMEKLRRQEPAAESAVWQWIEYVAYGLITLEHIFDAECIVLGGGIMENEMILQRVERRMRPGLMPGYRDVKLRKAELGNRAGMLGAFYLVKHAVDNDRQEN